MPTSGYESSLEKTLDYTDIVRYSNQLLIFEFVYYWPLIPIGIGTVKTDFHC